jgi:hypothetical protein
MIGKIGRYRNNCFRSEIHENKAIRLKKEEIAS